MTPLASAMQTHGLNGSAAAVREAFGVSRFVPRNNARYSYQGLVPIFGDTKVAVLLSVFRNLFDHQTYGEFARAEYAAFTIPSEDGATGGLNFADELRNGSIRQVAAAMSADPGNAQNMYIAAVLTEIADFGGKTRPLWEVCGLDALPTDAEITAAKAELVSAEVVNWPGDLRNRLWNVRNLVAQITGPMHGGWPDSQTETKALFSTTEIDDAIAQLQAIKGIVQ